jgi:vacuolar-type H+-ATPase subunit H
VNEKRIREVIEVEKRALDMVAQANREAEQIPVEAEARAASIVDMARAAARDEAQRMVQRAKEGQESSGILAQAAVRMSQTAGLAEKNLEKAVMFVLERVLARA